VKARRALGAAGGCDDEAADADDCAEDADDCAEADADEDAEDAAEAELDGKDDTEDDDAALDCEAALDEKTSGTVGTTIGVMIGRATGVGAVLKNPPNTPSAPKRTTARRQTTKQPKAPAMIHGVRFDDIFSSSESSTPAKTIIAHNFRRLQWGRKIAH
jgi:hypothetical protein